MKVGKEKRKKSFYILGYQLELIITNLAILIFVSSRNLANLGPFFLHGKSFCVGRNSYFSGRNLRKFGEILAPP
jgi:hypothetical protein